ncbi:MAG: hypothetical protein ACE5HN_07210 [Nitrospiria bacterium]
MKPIWVKILVGGCMGLLFFAVDIAMASELNVPSRDPVWTPEEMRFHPVASRLNNEGALAIQEASSRITKAEEWLREATSMIEEWHQAAPSQVINIQSGIGEGIEDSSSLVFSQLDRVAKLQEELGVMLRETAFMDMQTARKIESVRAGLEDIMIQSAMMQVNLSDQMGKGMKEVEQAILVRGIFPAGTDAHEKARVRLGQAIENNADLLRSAATELKEHQERVVHKLEGQATLLASTSGIIVDQQVLHEAKEAIEEGNKRLHDEMEEGARVTWTSVSRLENLQAELDNAIQNETDAYSWARGVVEEAITKLIMVTEIDPTFALAHYNCAIAFRFRNGPDDLKNAIHHLEMGLEVEPENRLLRSFYEEIKV